MEILVPDVALHHLPLCLTNPQRALLSCAIIRFIHLFPIPSLSLSAFTDLLLVFPPLFNSPGVFPPCSVSRGNVALEETASPRCLPPARLLDSPGWAVAPPRTCVR